MTDGQKSNGWSRLIITAIISILATSGFWNVLNQTVNSNRPTREEVRQMVSDKLEKVLESQRMLERKVDSLEGKIDAMNRLPRR